jgi:hypothetical protein
LFSPGGQSFSFWIEDAAHPCIIHPVFNYMFQNDEKYSYQPENISKKPCDLEDPHAGCSLFFKDKGLILLTNFPKFVFVKDPGFRRELL